MVGTPVYVTSAAHNVTEHIKNNVVKLTLFHWNELRKLNISR